MAWCDLGSYPTLSLMMARERAAVLAAGRRNGVDPVEERRRAIEAEAKRQRKEAAAAARMTVQGLFEQWEELVTRLLFTRGPGETAGNGKGCSGSLMICRGGTGETGDHPGEDARPCFLFSMG
jgi:hypothetical protein